MWQRIQTFVFVTLITVLIWLYAEGESLETKTFSMAIEFVTSGPKLWISPTKPIRAPNVTFEGPRWRMSQVADQLRKGPIQLQMTPNPSLQDVDQTIDLRQRLSELDLFTGLGVTIDTVDPPSQQVRVESYEFRNLPIQVMPEGKVRINATIEPQQAKIGVPVSYLDAIEGDEVHILVQPSIEDLPLNKEFVLEDVLLTFSDLVPASLVSIEPTTATVTLTVTSANVDSEPQNIPVHIHIPLAAMPKYEFIFDKDSGHAYGVVFNGPEEIIEQINADTEARKMLVKAFLRLGAQELAKAAISDQSITREVEFNLPANTIVSGAPPTVSFKVQSRRESAINVEESGESP